ncbi:MAG: YeeE/YedE family protein [Ignavibacteriales bacterium]|nr:YeeE/YedE family protein [Ignavibacteriales bacterium]
MKNPKPYLNPYLAGIGLGLVLLAAFVIMGRGLGASGAFTSVVAAGVNTVAPAHAQSNEHYKEYLNTPSGNPLKDWLVYEIAGVLVGGFFSGWISRRIKRTVEKSSSYPVSSRMFFAFFGGILLGFGSKLARGCTSGQALTGGALMSVGSWVFMIAVFASAYAFAYFFRRQWQ